MKPRDPAPFPTIDAGRALAVLTDFVRETHPGRAIEVGVDSRLERDLGLDSVARMEFALRLQHALGEAPPDAALNEADTLAEMLERWGQARGAPQLARPAPRKLGGAAVAQPTAAQSLIEVLAFHAARTPTRRHVVLPEENGSFTEISYGDLLAGARRIAAGLERRGVLRGQTVALMLPTGREYLECFFGVMIAGAWPVPIYPPTRPAQLPEHLARHARLLENAQAGWLITVPQAQAIAHLLPSVHAVLTPAMVRGESLAPVPKPRASDIAFLQYTSGSTGEPKGVVLTHANVLANIRAMGRAAQASSRDVVVSWLPLYHDMGLIGAWFGSLYHGCPLVLLSPLAFLARPVRWLQALSDFGGTLTAAPNFAYDLCARKLADTDLAGLDLSAVRVMFNGAEPVSADTLDAFATRLAPHGLRREALSPVYGLAECAVGLAFPPAGRGPLIDSIDRDALARGARAVPIDRARPDALRLPSCGRALPEHEMRVVGEAGGSLAEREVGRIQFRGPSATSGYFRNPQASRALFDDGWLDTGDYGYLAGGEIFLTGRAKDLIIRGGRNLYPYELEAAVGALPEVRRGCVAVFGATDLARGTEKLVVMAETRLGNEAARAALIERIRALAIDILELPPDEVLLVDPHRVLKTSSGKIRRAALRAQFEQGERGEPRSAWRTLAGVLVRTAYARVRRSVARAAQWGFGLWCWAAFLPLLLVVWPAVALPRAPRWGRWVTHFGARALLMLCGQRLPRLRAEQLPARAHVLAVNHASYADVLTLCAVLPPTLGHVFVAKRELSQAFWSDAFLRGLGALYVERGVSTSGAQEAVAMSEALKAGHSLIVFPEGTFTRHAGLRAFHMGGFVAAAQAGAPIATLALRGTRGVLRDQTWLPRPGKIGLELGAVLVPGGASWAAAVRLRDQARAQLSALCGEPDLEA